MIDTHTHIYTEEFDNDRAAVVARAKAAGVQHLILPNIDVDSLERIYATEAEFAPYCSLAMGLHPTSVTENYEADLQRLHAEFRRHEFCAVGEVGIDLYWDKSTKLLQQRAFATQVEWALAYDLPLIIHSRAAFDETYEVLSAFAERSLRGVFHCFEGTTAQAEKAMALGFSIGVNGVVTFKKSSIADVLRSVPLERVLIETDAPYLAPVPMRGKRNEPSFLNAIVAKIAEIYALDTEIIKQKTQKNAEKLFRLENF